MRDATPVMALLEGPYGHHHGLDIFETVVLVAGGVGVAPTLAYVQAYAQAPGRTTRVVLLFTARQMCFLREIERHLEEVGARGVVELKLFCTTGVDGDGTSDDAHSDEKSGEAEAGEGKVTYGRPELGAIVREEVGRAGATAGRIAFFVCGPAGMSDEMRREVVGCIGVEADGDKVSFFEEALNW
jgi:NAD(P)H-flavin reductase